MTEIPVQVAVISVAVVTIPLGVKFESIALGVIISQLLCGFHLVNMEYLLSFTAPTKSTGDNILLSILELLDRDDVTDIQ